MSPTRKWGALFWAALGVVLSLTTWFSATAIAPELASHFALSATESAWLTNAVQAGFVLGAIVSSVLSLADIWPVLRIIALASLLGAGANLLILVAPTFETVLGLRFLTGATLAFVYPVGMKFIATWFREGRGLAMGVMVGALTLGSAAPHFIRTFQAGADWTLVMVISSCASAVAALIFGLVLREGPYEFPRVKSDPRQIGSVLRNKPVMLANLGYFGHMWELYAMWGWFLAYAVAAEASGLAIDRLSLLAFAVIALGAPSCILAGWLADRIGRAATTAMAMTLSGLAAVAIGFTFSGPAWLFVTVAVIWGFTVVSDSAQFSAAVSELSDQSLVGSALAFQMGTGFAITIFTVWLVPQMAEVLGSWRWSFLVLAIGPAIGVISMLALRAHPDAIKMAGGRR